MYNEVNAFERLHHGLTHTGLAQNTDSLPNKMVNSKKLVAHTYTVTLLCYLCFSLSTNPWRKHMLLSINLINSNALLCFLGSRKSCPSATCLWAGSVRWVLKAAFVNVNFCKYRERKNPKELRRFAYLGDYYLCIHHLGGSFFLTDKLSLCSAVYQADMQTV